MTFLHTRQSRTAICYQLNGSRVMVFQLGGLGFDGRKARNFTSQDLLP
jgi:hypothetical protein